MRKIDESVAASLEQASWEAGSHARQGNAWQSDH